MRKLLCLVFGILSLTLFSVSVRANDDLEFSGWKDIIQQGDRLQGEDPQTESHSHSFDILKEDTATCGSGGTAVYACVCGEEMQMPSDATGRHEFGAPEYLNTDSHRAVCSICGKEETDGHSWDQGRIVAEANCKQSGEQVFTCSGCNGTYSRMIPQTGHDYDHSKSNDVYHVCGVCGSAESHLWDDGEVTRRPSCNQTGTFEYHCSICDMKLVETLDKLTTHTYDSACDPECNTCGQKRETAHTFTVTWSNNYKGHWHECTQCGEQKDFSRHDPGPEATEDEEQICLICKYIIAPKKNHVHRYEAERSYDEVGHWFECRGCGNEKEYASHTFHDDCDTDCAYCGYIRENAHSYDGKWQMSNFEHWTVCTICGEETKREKHTPGPEATQTSAQVCTVCAFEFVPKQNHVHTFGPQWLYSDDTHWQLCSCGEQSVPMSHIWDTGRENRDGTITYTCGECSLERNVQTPASGIPGVVIIFVMLAFVCAAGIGVLVIIMRRGGFVTDRRYDPYERLEDSSEDEDMLP